MGIETLELNLDSTINWKEFDLRTCSRCKLCKVRRNVAVPKIVPKCKVMFVAEAPGYDEDVYGEPLVGKSGRMLNECLEAVGISRVACSVANCVQCKPPNNREPEKDELEACHDILEHYIKEASPEVIVPLGNVAMRRVLRKSGITKYNGHICESKHYPGIKIVPVVHPSFALRDPKNVELLTFGLRKVKELTSGQVMTKVSETTYVDTYEKFDLMMKDLQSKPYFALDIEASTLKDWINGYIICISFSNASGKSYVLPWIVGDDEFYNTCKRVAPVATKREVVVSVEEFCSVYKLNKPKFKWDNTDVKARLQALLSDVSYAKILHNYAYDYKYLEKAGLRIDGAIYDTMIMHYLLDEKRGTHGLDDLTLAFTSYGEYWKPLEKYVMNKKTVDKYDTYAIIPIDELIPYAGTDSDVTFQLFNLFYNRIEKEGFLTLYLSFLVPLTKMLMQTEKNGFAVDEEYRQELEIKLTKEIQDIDAKLNEFAKDVVANPKKPDKKGINFNSTKQLSFFLFEYLRLPVLGKTDKNAPSTDVDVLTGLSYMHDVPKLLLDRRKKNKLLTTYVIGLKNQLWSDGKVHPIFNIIGTETGRLSCNGPNLQQLPRKDADLDQSGINIRNLFKVTNPETHYLVEVDYSQAELRLIAEYSRDKNLYNAFLNGRDPHAELALRIYHSERIPEMEAGTIDARNIVTKEERQKGKTANFSLVYGKAAENFAVENGIPLEEAYEIHNVFWRTYQGITDWKIKTLTEAYRTLEFTSFFGRKRRMKKLLSEDARIRSEAEREGINSVIQVQASDYTLYSILKATKVVQENNYDVKTVSFVHDSGVFEVNKNCIQEFLTLLKSIMVKCPGVSLPMEIDIKVGYKLGSLKEWTSIDGIWQEKPKKA